MKKIIILLVVLVAVIGIALFKSNERKTRHHHSVSSAKMREMLFPDFDVNAIRKVRIKEDKGEATLVVKNDTWVIQERGGYPLEKEKLQTALLSLKYEKIKASRHIGKDSWSKVGVDAPGKDAATGGGMLVELYDDKDVLKHSFVLGGQVTSSGGSDNDQMSMFGGGPKGNRFVRIDGDDAIYEINDQLPDLVTKPDAWLDKTFFDVQKVKSVEVTAATPADSWKAARADENADFILEGAKPGEKIDAGKASLATLLSSPTFNDVLGKDQAATLMKGAVKAKIVTFDGFTYNVQAVKQAGKDGGGDKYYLTVSTSAEIPKERPAVKDEKPEDKTKNDAAFADEKKKVEEKLANEKKLDGWVYEVTEYTVSTLLKPRSEIIAPDMKGAPAPADGSKPGGLPDVKKMIPGLNPEALRGAPIFAPPTSPVPEAPQPQIKPAPSPDANPITGEKPAPAAPTPPAEPAKPAAAATPAPSPVPAAEPAKPAAEEKK